MIRTVASWQTLAHECEALQMRKRYVTYRQRLRIWISNLAIRALSRGQVAWICVVCRAALRGWVLDLIGAFGKLAFFNWAQDSAIEQ